MPEDKQKFGAADLSTHHLLLLKEVPDSLIALRREILNHSDIRGQAEKGQTFEECLGIIAAQLDIVLDGDYDVGPLCEMLVDVLRKRNTLGTHPHLRHQSLVDVELVEREGTVEIAERDRNITTVVPDGGIITHTSSSISSEQENKKSPVSTTETGDGSSGTCKASSVRSTGTE